MNAAPLGPAFGLHPSRRPVITEAEAADAKRRRCGLCQQPPDAPCRNIATGDELPDGTVHFYRIEPK